MFQKVLIANRGEIAMRIIRACRELKTKTVAVFSTADRDSLHVKFADESICIGPPSPAESYLSIQRIIAAAEISNADAIHPGYGFLAENADFAEICTSHGFAFIGPRPNVITIMGDKAQAKRTMSEAGCPVVPGSDGPVTSAEEAKSLVQKIKLPLMIKAVAGGGGRGMRVVRELGALETAFEMARAEAEAGFKDDALYLEKLIDNARHIEIQILGDGKGGAIHLGERDCSIQRRHQKLIEETPSPVVSKSLREKIGETAVNAAAAIEYASAGTMEFLLDSEGNYYFMEMNTRIQVEHPITEMVTGVDLVKEQILIAAGEPLHLKQKELKPFGHAIECRINAEDPERNFLPCPGKVTGFHAPGGPGVRVDTHVYEGYEIPPYYDSLIAKLVAWGRTRAEAIARMERALEEFVIEGLQTTIPLHLKIIRSEAFQRGEYHTRWIEEFMEQQANSKPPTKS
ncbi:MAG: acetyl-CoA carboxylase biotin carboxylase subunit [Calditrichaeota bacterium]|nr:acetyl-CoA carboxylase biotin carboxylase subunit [Calditrichota bacterium]